MIGKDWQAVPGLGANQLERIGEDVRRHNQWSDRDVAYMAEIAGNLDGEVASLTNEAMEVAMGEGTIEDLDRLMDELTEEEKMLIVKAKMASASLEAVKRERGGTDFAGYGRRVKLAVNEDGVRRWKTLSTNLGYELGDDDPSKWREISPGTVMEGRFQHLSSRPEVGGLLVVEHRLFTSYIKGLVSPEDGVSRVEMDQLVVKA